VPSPDKRQLIIKRIVEALIAERIRLGLSQNQVAIRAGLDHTMVMRVEKMERTPTIDTLLRIADALDLELGSVITAASKTPASKSE